MASDGDLARQPAVPGVGSLLPALDDIAGAAVVIDPWVTDFEDELPMIGIPFLCPQGEYEHHPLKDVDHLGTQEFPRTVTRTIRKIFKEAEK